MTSLTNPSNPEAALLPIRERPSLDWLRFALEELTPHQLQDGNMSKSFSYRAKLIGYNKSAGHQYLLKLGTVSAWDKSDSITEEATAIIESLILKRE